MESIQETEELVCPDPTSDVIGTGTYEAEGVIVGRSFRANYGSLHLAIVKDAEASYYPPPTQDSEIDDDDDDDDTMFILVRLQFHNGHHAAIRSYCRRFCKIGDRLVVREGYWKKANETVDTEWHAPRLVLDLLSTEQTERLLQVKQSYCWTMKQCQAWRQAYMPTEAEAAVATGGSKKPTPAAEKKARDGHGGSIVAKHAQVNCLTKFLIGMTNHRLNNNNHNNPKEQLDVKWGHPDHDISNIDRQRAVEALSGNGGVLDVAGGTGHLSMALGMAGIRATVIDPRPSVGLLNRKDRKVFRKALQRSRERTTMTAGQYCLPVVQEFSSQRAWFGSHPEGVDHSFRQPDEQPEDVPTIQADNQLLQDCTTIVALHPDEATEVIVDMAVANRIPFCIVPCCVFHRLFPGRRFRGKNVSTYEDLLDYLQAKDPSIRRNSLPFFGKNTVLWSTFS